MNPYGSCIVLLNLQLLLLHSLLLTFLTLSVLPRTALSATQAKGTPPTAHTTATLPMQSQYLHLPPPTQTVVADIHLPPISFADTLASTSTHALAAHVPASFLLWNSCHQYLYAWLRFLSLHLYSQLKLLYLYLHTAIHHLHLSHILYHHLHTLIIHTHTLTYRYPQLLLLPLLHLFLSRRCITT